MNEKKEFEIIVKYNRNYDDTEDLPEGKILVSGHRTPLTKLSESVVIDEYVLGIPGRGQLTCIYEVIRVGNIDYLDRSIIGHVTVTAAYIHCQCETRCIITIGVSRCLRRADI